MKKIILIILLFLAAFGVSNLLVSIVVMGVLGVDSVTDNPMSMFIIYAASFSFTVALMAIFRKSLSIHLPSFKPEIHRLNLPLILLGVITLLAINVVINPMVSLMPQSNMDALYDMMSGGMWAILTGVIAAPIIEEYIFRGVLQRSFLGITGRPVISIIISALVFGAIHIIPQQMISAFLAGIVLGIIFQLTHSLSTVVIIHMLNNGIAYIEMMYFGENSDILELFFSSPLSYSILYTSSLVLVILLGIWAFRQLARQRNASRQPLYGAK